ncbi:50S ribosomal protein L4 [Candidatus Saccharibacteria bacterium]|nr:50S ribosomal protein L4 [Candidatus Saccharibacteria bacterium]HOR23429.1 50S ribosomal protein L4 [Candidatus Saccharibacteria bacterium]HPW48422.1 50S ribosomal protein L4 [Candidatus Saccharibacteria bacterium]
MTTQVFSSKGNKLTSSVKLPKEIFGVEIKNHQLLKDVYVANLANKRPPLAKTLSRGEVRGGGAKPWRQKGTGRARVGSTRNPIWRGGGVVFGPKGAENYSKKVNVRAKRRALSQALTLADKANKIIVLESFDTTGKTKDTIKLMDKVGAKRKVLLVLDAVDKTKKLATNNLSDVCLKCARQLSVNDVLDADTLILTKGSIELIEAWLGR